MVTPDQIRAARALKNWSQTDLAERTGLTTPTIANIELGKQTPGIRTVEKIIDAFTLGGVVFTRRGVQKREADETVVTLTRDGQDKNIFLTLLEDVYYTLTRPGVTDKELLIICSDDRISPPEVISIDKRMRREGIRFRHLVEDGNTHLTAPLQDYRCIPKEFFINRVGLIYGDKYALALDSAPDKPQPETVVIIRNKDMADVQRNLFNLLWSQLPQPTFTTARDDELIY